MIAPRHAVLAALPFLASACVVSVPQPMLIPQSVQVRVTKTELCPPEAACAGYPRELRFEGTLISLDADTFVLYAKRRQSQVAIPVPSIAKLEVYRGHRGSFESAAKGAAVGTVAGAGLGAMAAGAGTILGKALLGDLAKDADIGEAMAEGAIEGATTGMVVGAVAGATIGSPVWEPVTVHQLRQELCHCRLPAEPRADSVVTVRPYSPAWPTQD